VATDEVSLRCCCPRVYVRLIGGTLSIKSLRGRLDARASHISRRSSTPPPDLPAPDAGRRRKASSSTGPQPMKKIEYQGESDSRCKGCPVNEGRNWRERAVKGTHHPSDRPPCVSPCPRRPFIVVMDAGPNRSSKERIACE